MDKSFKYLNYYRYVASGVEFQIAIRTQTLAPYNPLANLLWLSPICYDDPIQAQTELASPYIPVWRIGPISRTVIPEESLKILRLVDPSFGFPGGGVEDAVDSALDIDPDWMVYDF